MTYGTETVKESIVTFTTEQRDTDELPLGETRVVQVGKDGFSNVTYKITFHDGLEDSREETGREVIQPVKQIVEVGTFVEPEPEPEP